MGNKKETNRYTINAVDKALDLLELLAEKPMNLLEIVERLNQPKSSVYRLITTFEDRGYINRVDGDGKYCLGLKTLELTKNLLEDNTLLKVARSEMEKLANNTGESVNLGIISGEHILYVDVIEGSHPLKFAEKVGTTGPIHCTAIGKVIASQLSEKELKNLLDKIKFTKKTPNTIDSKDKFIEELQRIKKKGYALDDEEIVTGARCIAAPIFNMFGNVKAAISISGAAHRISDDNLENLSSQVIEAANNISKLLGNEK
mgnify:CR=1 FL=1